MQKNSINASQTGILMFFLCFTNKILIMPSLLYKQVKTDGILTYLFGFLIDFILLFLFIFLKKKYQNLSFFQILSKNLTKYIAIFIYIFAAIYFLSKIVLVFNVTLIYFKQKIYPDGNLFFFLLCFLPIIVHSTILGLRVLGRGGQFFFIIVLASFLACFFISLSSYDRMPVLFDSNLKDFSLAYLGHIFSFGDFLVLFFMMDKVRLEKGQTKNLIIFSLLGMAVTLSIIVSFYVIYQSTAFLYTSAISDIISINSSLYQIGQIELFAMFIVLFITFYQLEIFLYAYNDTIISIFPKLKTWVNMIWFCVIFSLISYFLFNNIEKVLFLGEQVFPYLSILPVIIIPILFVILIIKRRKEE